jgi:hypothetical protein
MGLIDAFLSIPDALFRMHSQRSHARRWFCIDKPARIKAGAGPDGLFDDGRSEADKERLPYAKTCCPEAHRAWNARRSR